MRPRQPTLSEQRAWPASLAACICIQCKPTTVGVSKSSLEVVGWLLCVGDVNAAVCVAMQRQRSGCGHVVPCPAGQCQRSQSGTLITEIKDEQAHEPAPAVIVVVPTARSMRGPCETVSRLQ